MDRRDGFDGFDFDDYLVFDDEVGPEARVKADCLVEDGDDWLARKEEPAIGEFMSEDGFVDGFEEAGAEGGVDAICGVDNLSGDGVFGHFELSFADMGCGR